MILLSVETSVKFKNGKEILEAQYPFFKKVDVFGISTHLQGSEDV